MSQTSRLEIKQEAPFGASMLRMRIGFVDDQVRLIEVFTEAFNQKGIHIVPWEFCLPEKNSIIASLLDAKLDVLLLDYHLSSWYKGRDLAKELLSQGCRSHLIGFSTDPYTAPLFAKVGVHVFVQKRPADPGRSVEDVLALKDTLPDIAHE